MVRLERSLDGLFDKAGRLVDPRIDPLLARGDKLFAALDPFLTETNCCLTPHFHSRKLLQELLPRIFQYEFTEFPESDTFGRIAENIRNRRCTIVCLTHFDKGEVPALVGMFAERLDDKILASNPKVVVAAADHQKKVAILGWLGNIDMAWIVNEDTIRLEREGLEKAEKRHGIIFSWKQQEQGQKKKKRKRLGMGLREFTIKAKDAVKNGGLIFLALQAGRRPKLGEPVGVLSLLLKRLEEGEQDVDYDILILGSVLKDPVWEVGDWEIGESMCQMKSWEPVKSYVGRDGFNLKSLHEFRAGPIVSRKDLMTELGVYTGESADISRLNQADALVFKMIRELGLVDDAYLG